MTDKYVVFIRNPLHLEIGDMIKPVMEMMTLEPNVPTQFFVLDKFTGELVAKYEQRDNFVFLHSINAYDYVDPTAGRRNVHVDLCSYQNDARPYCEYNFSNIADPGGPFVDGTLTRYELAAVDTADPAIAGRVTVAAAMPGMASELPRIAKSASTVSGYRYVYSTSGKEGASPGTAVPIGRLGNGLKVIQAAFLGSLAKSDCLTGTFKKCQPRDGESCPCEPVLVQRPGAAKEDDGIVLTTVIDREGTRSILVALDGMSFEEVARAYLPQVYALGPHGSFIEGDFGQ